MSDRLREIEEKRTRGSLPIGEWGPTCAGCGGEEFRIDGYCSCECRDYHDDEDIALFAAELASARAQLERANALLRHVVDAERIERLPGDHAVSVALLTVDEYLAVPAARTPEDDAR